MNYFELFEFPVQLKVDKERLRKRYLELSRTHHPDYFIQNGVTEQEAALETSALLNKGFKTLNNSDETIGYVLTLKGLLTENEKYNLPPDFLMEMMELNEALAEAGLSDGHTAPEKLIQQIQAMEHEIYEPVQSIIENYQEGVTSEKELLQVKDYYFKKKYIQRLKTGLSQKL